MYPPATYMFMTIYHAAVVDIRQCTATQGGRLGRSLSVKPTKVTSFTMILYNAENNILKPIPNKFFVTFELLHCSR